jgi:hypothetical protein
VNTSTEVRPAPPSCNAIVVAPKFTVVWKKPVTPTASHDSGNSVRPLPQQHREHRDDGNERALDIENDRVGVAQRQLHHHPIATPK